MKKSINIHGISTTAAYQEGDCMQLVNLRKKNGVHKPVTPRKIVRTTTEQYVYTFQHNLPQTGENLIGVRNNNIYLVGETSETLLTSVSGFKSITQIGNILNILDETGIKQLWWINNTYQLIQTNFSGETNATVIPPIKIDIKTEAVTNSDNKRLVRKYYNTDYVRPIFDRNEDDIADNYKKIIIGLASKAEAINKNDGYINNYCLICTAIELYDGTYIQHSHPQLINPPFDIYTRFNLMIDEHGPFNYITNNKLCWGMWKEKNGDYNEKDDYYTSYANDAEAYPMIDYGNVTSDDKITTGFPDMLSCVYFPSLDSYTDNYLGLFTSLNQIKYKIQNEVSESYKSLIKSISIFITQDVNPYNNEMPITVRKSGFIPSPLDVSTNKKSWTFYRHYKSNEDILKSLSENQQFYKVHEIPFDEIKTTTDNEGWVTIDLKGKLGDNLIMQEELPVDNFTHHNIIPNVQMVYNSKLHLMNYKQELFPGWPYSYLSKESGIGQFASEQLGESTITTVVKLKTETGTSILTRTGNYQHPNLPTMLSYPDSRAYEMNIYYSSKWVMMSIADLQLARTIITNYPSDKNYWSNEEYNSGLAKVILAKVINIQTGVVSNSYKTNARYIIGKRTFTLNETTASLNVGNTGEFGIIISINSISGIIYYTEASTEPIATLTWTIAINSYTNKFYTYKLTASETANFSYWINSELKPQTILNLGGSNYETIPTAFNNKIVYQNSMKVSSVNNPFYYPSDTTYNIGTGTILNASSNAQRMSEGQFGQYDLYVFTNEGIYSLDTGTEITYNRQSPASLEIPTSDILCAIPYGVVFVGKRGLYLINGQQTELLSAKIEEESETNNIYGASLSFLTFLQTLKDILYDNVNNELIIVNTAHDYNWVLNIENKMWYMSTEKIDFEVKNSSPNLLVVAGTTIKDYSKSGSNMVAVSFITRPLYFGIDEVKDIQRAILRSKLFYLNTTNNQNAQFYSIYGSNDGVNNKLLRAWQMPLNKQDRTFKDLDSGIMARSTFRNYTIAFEGAISEQSEISHIDFEVKDNYSNDKLR